MELLEKEKAQLDTQLTALTKDLQEYQSQQKEDDRKYINDMDYLKEQIISTRKERDDYFKHLQETKEKLRVEIVYKNTSMKQIQYQKETENRLSKTNHELQEKLDETKLQTRKEIHLAEKQLEILCQKYDTKLFIVKNKLHTLA